MWESELEILLVHSKDTDVVDDSEEEESDEEMNNQAGLYPLQPLNYLLINSVLQPEVKDFRRSAAPSPEAKKRRQWRSVRIPDFAQLLFEVDINKSNGTLNNYRTGVLLLVEIKKAMPSGSCRIFDFAKVLQQTDEQARHAFASYPGVNALGAVIALGDCWTYREYFRKDLRPSPSLSERLDPTFGKSGHRDLNYYVEDL